MKHLVAILIKFAAAAVIIEAYMLLVTNVEFSRALLVSAAITIVSYFIGDILILRRAGNIVATLVDVVLAFFIVFLSRLINGFSDTGITDAIFIAVLLGIEEWFFHKYMAGAVLGGEQ